MPVIVVSWLMRATRSCVRLAGRTARAVRNGDERRRERLELAQRLLELLLRSRGLRREEFERRARAGREDVDDLGHTVEKGRSAPFRPKRPGLLADPSPTLPLSGEEDGMAAVVGASATPKERWSFSWKHLYDEVVTSGLCTGCAGCVIACPHDVLGYDDTNGVYKPFQIEDYGGPGDCSHGDKACTSCTRACPRFRAWEPEIDEFLFGRPREPEELCGVLQGHLPRPRRRPGAARGRPGRRARVGDPRVRARARHHRRRARELPRGRRHLVEGDSRRRANRDDVIASAGSRYTYSANTLAYADLAKEAERIALVGMCCQSSVPPVMKQRKAGKVARGSRSTSGSCARRPSTTRSSRSCSRRSTA